MGGKRTLELKGSPASASANEFPNPMRPAVQMEPISLANEPNPTSPDVSPKQIPDVGKKLEEMAGLTAALTAEIIQLKAEKNAGPWTAKDPWAGKSQVNAVRTATKTASVSKSSGDGGGDAGNGGNGGQGHDEKSEDGSDAKSQGGLRTPPRPMPPGFGGNGDGGGGDGVREVAREI